jgi:hypothetical protein
MEGSREGEEVEERRRGREGVTRGLEGSETKGVSFAWRGR